jgi:hypothetical protein
MFCKPNSGDGSVLSHTFMAFDEHVDFAAIQDSLIKWGYRMLVAFLQQHD